MGDSLFYRGARDQQRGHFRESSPHRPQPLLDGGQEGPGHQLRPALRRLHGGGGSGHRSQRRVGGRQEEEGGSHALGRRPQYGQRLRAHLPDDSQGHRPQLQMPEAGRRRRHLQGAPIIDQTRQPLRNWR